MKLDPPFICNLIEMEVAYIPYTGDFIKHPEVYEQLSFELCKWAGPRGLLTFKEVFISSYRPDPQAVTKAGMALDSCITIPKRTKVGDGIQRKTLPGGLYAVRRAELSEPADYISAWGKFSRWLVDSDYQLDSARPCNERYLTDPRDNPDKDHVVYLCISISPKTA